MARTCEVCGEQLATDAEYQTHVDQTHNIREVFAALRQARTGRRKWGPKLVAGTGVLALFVAAASSYSTYHYADTSEKTCASRGRA